MVQKVHTDTQLQLYEKQSIGINLSVRSLLMFICGVLLFVVYFPLLFRAETANTNVPIYQCFYVGRCELVLRISPRHRPVRNPCRKGPSLG